jgi:hypothetical protein
MIDIQMEENMEAKTQSVNLDKSIKIIDKIYADLLSANSMIPDPDNLETMRLNLDNIQTLLESTIIAAQELKGELDKLKKLTLETWNPPA